MTSNRNKPKFLPICVGVALAICALGTLFSVKGWFAPLTETVAVLTAPLRFLCNRAADGLVWLGAKIGAGRG